MLDALMKWKSWLRRYYLLILSRCCFFKGMQEIDKFPQWELHLPMNKICNAGMQIVADKIEGWSRKGKYITNNMLSNLSNRSRQFSSVIKTSLNLHVWKAKRTLWNNSHRPKLLKAFAYCVTRCCVAIQQSVFEIHFIKNHLPFLQQACMTACSQNDKGNPVWHYTCSSDSVESVKRL